MDVWRQVHLGDQEHASVRQILPRPNRIQVHIRNLGIRLTDPSNTSSRDVKPRAWWEAPHLGIISFFVHFIFLFSFYIFVQNKCVICLCCVQCLGYLSCLCFEFLPSMLRLFTVHASQCHIQIEDNVQIRFGGVDSLFESFFILFFQVFFFTFAKVPCFEILRPNVSFKLYLLARK